MEGKEFILSNIINTAQASAKNILSDALSERENMLLKLREDLDKRHENAVAAAQNNAEELLRRRMTLCDLEQRKIELAAKKRVIDGVYLQVIQKLQNMTDHIYREFMSDVIALYAEDGDMIMVCQRDAKRLHKEWADSLSKKLKKRLSLSDELLPNRGGVILAGKNYDKNLTFETMIAELRQETETQTAKRLFGGAQ